MPLNGLLVWRVLCQSTRLVSVWLKIGLSLLCPLACSAAVPALQDVPVQPASPLCRSSAPLPLGLHQRAHRLRASSERQALCSRGNGQKSAPAMSDERSPALNESNFIYKDTRQSAKQGQIIYSILKSYSFKRQKGKMTHYFIWR